MVQCPLDPGHWMPDTSLPSHLEECKQRRSGIDFSGYVSCVTSVVDILSCVMNVVELCELSGECCGAV